MFCSQGLRSAHRRCEAVHTRFSAEVRADRGTERIWAALFMLSLTKCKLDAAAKLSLTSSTPGNNICMWTRYLCNDILSPRPPPGWRLPYLDLFFSQIAGWNLMYGRKKKSGERKLIWCISGRPGAAKANGNTFTSFHVPWLVQSLHILHIYIQMEFIMWTIDNSQIKLVIASDLKPSAPLLSQVKPNQAVFRCSFPLRCTGPVLNYSHFCHRQHRSTERECRFSRYY